MRISDGSAGGCSSDLTPRKARMAAGARIDGTQWERAQRIARALADTHDAGAVPAVLARVATKAELFALANEEKEHCGGYYDAPRLLGSPYDWREVEKKAKGAAARPEEGRGGKGCVRPCRSGWARFHSKKKKK